MTVAFSILLILIAIVLFSCSSFFAMKPAGTGQVLDTGIYAVKNSRNSSFFIKTDEGYIMIDAGTDVKRFKSLFYDKNIDVKHIKYILLTHSDLDHTASLPLFPNAKIFISRDEIQLLDGTTKRSPLGGNKLPKGIDINGINLLSDGQELLLGGKAVKCIAAPGHTPGSMFFLIDDKYLFTGDAFMLKKGKIDIHPFTMDSNLSRQTIGRLKEVIESSFVFTSHYGVLER